MSQRIRHLWLPGLVGSVLAMGLLFVIQRTGPAPRIIVMGRFPFLLLYWPWLLALPGVGALASYWSERAGGGTWQRVLAGIFPAAAPTALFVAILPVAFIVDRGVPTGIQLFAFAIMLLNWSVIPGAALFLGTLPLLSRHAHPSLQVGQAH